MKERKRRSPPAKLFLPVSANSLAIQTVVIFHPPKAEPKADWNDNRVVLLLFSEEFIIKALRFSYNKRKLTIIMEPLII
ncbi:MAG: hypothetical protein Q8O16_03550 [Dehalococcoidia bacterium]|nr:hypothetical protein [Dehalococcoidia bacterium]